MQFSKANLPKQLFINNEYVDARSTKTLTLRNPNDESIIAQEVPIAGPEDVDRAVDCAEKAFQAWKKTLPADRRRMLLRLADLLEKHMSLLGDIGRVSMGFTVASVTGEIGAAIEGLRYYAGFVDKFAGESYPQDDGFLKIVRHEPLGVTAGIVPWNGPLVTVGLKAAPGLATGNCFILKPSEKAPFSCLALGELIQQAGFPPGVFQVLSGDGSTGALLASHMRIRKLTFTGSCATGKKIQELAARSNLKRVTLELGGKSPAVIFNDCDVDNAVKWTVTAITANSGQACFAASRVYVQKGIYDVFIKKYKEAMQIKSKHTGDPNKSTTQLGPLIDQGQFDRVMGFIQRGQQGQGTLAVGGGRVGEKVRSMPLDKFLTNTLSSRVISLSLQSLRTWMSTRKSTIRRSLVPSPSSGVLSVKRRFWLSLTTQSSA